MLDLDAGVFTCITPGYYTVSFYVLGLTGPVYGLTQRLYLYKNGDFLPESLWLLTTNEGANDRYIGVTSSRIMVRLGPLGYVCMKAFKCEISPDSPPGCRRHS